MPPEELDLDLCLTSGQVFCWQRTPDGTWTGVEGASWFVVGPPESDGSRRFWTNGSPEALRKFLRADVSRRSVDAEILQRGPEVGAAVASLPGLRLLAPLDPEQVLFSFLCTANNNLARIGAMVRRLNEFGEPFGEQPDWVSIAADPGGAPMKGGGDDFAAHDHRGEGVAAGGSAAVVLRRFPDADRIASVGESELRKLGFGYRGRTIPIVARELMERPPGWLASLAQASLSEAHRELTRLTGVGPKLADCIALYGLGHMDAAPVDTHLAQAVCRLYCPEEADKAMSGSRYHRVADALRNRFGPWTGWAQLLLYYHDLRQGRKQTV